MTRKQIILWTEIEERAHSGACPICGQGQWGDAGLVSCDKIWGTWRFHPACIDPVLENYEALLHEINVMSEQMQGSTLKSYDQVHGWGQMSQKELGAVVVPTEKIVGTSSEGRRDFASNWYPYTPLDARYLRTLFQAYLARAIGGVQTAASFLDVTGYKHLFYFPARGEYYVCMQGNRRTSVARVLRVRKVQYAVTQVGGV